MKVLYVYEKITSFGGVERIFVDKMNWLANNSDINVFLLTYNQGIHQMPFELDKNVTYTDLNVMTFKAYQYYAFRRIWNMFKRTSMLKRMIHDFITDLAPDIIITTTLGPVDYLLEAKGNARLVIESHSGFNHIIESANDSYFFRCKYRLQKNRIRKADCVVALTEGDADLWRTFHHHVVIIPNFIHSNETDSYSTLENKKVIYVGRYGRQKAIPDLIEIWKLVNKCHPDWGLEMYGEGMYDKFLRDVLENNNFNITVHQPISDIHLRMLESSIFIIASLYEPFGLVIGEAMSCGLPVVAFNCPFGPGELITNNVNGYLIDNRDIKAFANKVCQLIEDRALRQRMGLSASKSIKCYNAELIMPKWQKLFESLVK